MNYLGNTNSLRINTVFRNGDTLTFYGFLKLTDAVVLRTIGNTIVLRPQKEKDKYASFVLHGRSIESKEIADIFENHNSLGMQFFNVKDAYWPIPHRIEEDVKVFLEKMHCSNAFPIN